MKYNCKENEVTEIWVELVSNCIFYALSLISV
jgi:hypothetical protein